MPAVGRMLHVLRARLHKACGWLAYRFGWSRLARSQYERVLLHGGADFSAYIHLGRLAFDQGDYAGWRREFEHARRLDPARFSQLRHQQERFAPRLAGTPFRRLGDDDGVFDETADRATWRTLRPFAGATGADRHAQADAGFDSSLDPALDPSVDAALDALLPNGNDPSRPGLDGRSFEDQSLLNDDCSSAAERRRLLAMGPIPLADCKRCDLDELARRLIG